jgi:hypothetical protein
LAFFARKLAFFASCNGAAFAKTAGAAETRRPADGLVANEEAVHSEDRDVAVARAEAERAGAARPAVGADPARPADGLVERAGRLRLVDDLARRASTFPA